MGGIRLDIFSFSQMWEVTGPIIIMAMTALAIGIVCWLVFLNIPSGFGRELFRIFSLASIAIGSLVAVYIAAGIWGWRG